MDFIITIMLLLANAIIAAIYEFKANRAIGMLEARLKIAMKVLRNGEWVDVESEHVVPDNIVKLSMGDTVPADGVVIEGSLMVDGSVLTGESIPIGKSVNGNVYACTTVLRGEAIVKVTSTGARTRFGKTVELIQIAKPRLIIEEIADSITKWLLVLDSFFIFSCN